MTQRTCAHGIPWQSTKVWNENCVQCQSIAELNQAALERGHHSAGGLDNDEIGVAGQRQLDAIVRRRQSAERLEQLWRDRRRRGTEWRAEAVKFVLAHPPRYEDDVAAVVKEPGLFTDKQMAVVEHIYGRGLSQREAARALGISRTSLRDRLESVNLKLRKRGVPTTGGRGRSNLELRRVVGWDFGGPPPVTKLRWQDIKI